MNYDFFFQNVSFVLQIPVWLETIFNMLKPFTLRWEIVNCFFWI